ncbi:hypothetical protein E1B28_000688 [Marasmius oreades]|uniref:K Homology domain-containing protein n=1 Tax=Marasmius oreades TaxID=181124 RepID=A0A9P7V1T6_9AGAR|nr:uncharacterized protein E1B28_000688 [Marasmius oreades]KAG7098781.1 hypothetical protein E1B28_000688 [Marasmius oreades]
MALSAADLQRKHEQEGTPDPFPPFDSALNASRSKKSAEELDTDSHSAFPSLASTGPPKAVSSAWGTSNGPRIKPVINKPLFTDTLTLGDIDLTTAGKDGKVATLGEVMKQVMAKYKVKMEASGNQKTRQTTFHVKAETQKELDKAKKSLLALLSPIITLTLEAPVSTIATIIGTKGSTLKQIRDQTGVKVDVPRKETVTIPAANGVNTSPDDENEDEPTVSITLTGPQPLAYEAKELLNQIIASKTSKSTQRVRDIPVHVLPFIIARKNAFEEAAQGGDVKLSLNKAIREVTVQGDREAVVRVIESIKSTVEELKANLKSIKMSLPKRQHRLLVDKAAQDLLAKTNCAVVVAPADDPSDEVTVWGEGNNLVSGLAIVMEQANSKHIHEFPLPGPIALSKQYLAYMTQIQYPKTLADANPGVLVFLPSPAAAEKAHSLNLDIVGNKPQVDAVVRQVSELIGKLIGATKEVNIDWLVHRVVTGKNAKKIKQFHDVHNVSVYFPHESDEKSSVLLVYDPFSPGASPSPDEKSRHLEEVAAELLKMAKDAADVKSETLQVEKRWHEAIIGNGGTTLNAIIGEDKALSVKFGINASDSATEDTILVRGASADVSRAVKEILKIVENAGNDEIINSFSTQFDVEREYVGRIVGSQGAGVNRLRDQLGVKIDVFDDVEDKDKEGAKKKRAVHQKSKVKITGRKENVEEAQKRILAQVERLADETSEILKVPSQYHSSLIGTNGKYVIRLEEKYGVKITFPRQVSDSGESKTREPLKLDEVLLKGGKKGVAQAKAELLEAVEFEKETNNVLKFTVPTRSVPRILGRAGASINEIKDATEAQIDVDRADDASVTNITVRGTKKAVNAAKTAILAIADQVSDEVHIVVPVENKYHRTLIGAGGQGLKDLVSRCGGPTDSRLLAGLIRFPRQGEPSDEVRLRGEAKLVAKLQIELEKAVAVLRDRVVLGVEIPAINYRALIGRNGQHLNDLQNRTGTQVQFPGSRSYAQAGEAENLAELGELDPANLVKVSGTRAACEKAIADLKVAVKSATPESVTDTISVPLKYHHTISQQGNFFRTLRSFGVQVDQSVQPQSRSVPARPTPSVDNSAARIDAEEDEPVSVPEVEWEVIENYKNAEEGDSVWTLKARDQAGLERARKLTEEAIEHAKGMSHVGFLTLPDKSSFPRIVGSKGANVARLRNETGADITVGRDNNTIVIVGSESDINVAKSAILRLASSSGRSQRQRD